VAERAASDFLARVGGELKVTEPSSRAIDLSPWPPPARSRSRRAPGPPRGSGCLGRHAVRPRFALGGIPPDRRGDRGPGRRIPLPPPEAQQGNQFIPCQPHLIPARVVCHPESPGWGTILAKCVSSSGSPGMNFGSTVTGGVFRPQTPSEIKGGLIPGPLRPPEGASAPSPRLGGCPERAAHWK